MFCLEKCSIIAARQPAMMDCTKLKAAVLTLPTLYDLVPTATSTASLQAAGSFVKYDTC